MQQIAESRRASTFIEWPTLALIAATLAAWITVTLAEIPSAAAVPLLALILAQHSSLHHEIIHGHPFRDPRLNDALAFPALGLLVPYGRFRDLHLAHHHDPLLTDPHDDPESNYLDPALWTRLPRPARLILALNNTLIGRMLIGPPLAMARLWANDLAALARGDRHVARAYALHALGILPVALWLGFAQISVAAYVLACWLALSILRIRTFLEHRAHTRHGARSVIIEDRGPLALLFLNNNFHAVHHAHPNLAWYLLPAEYARRRADFLRRNDDYRYRSYAQVFGLYLFRRKDPVPHPIWTPPAALPPAPAVIS